MQFLRRHMMVAQNIACLAMVAHLWATFSCCLAFGDPDAQAQVPQISMEMEVAAMDMAHAEHAGHHDHHDHHASHDMAAHNMAPQSMVHMDQAAADHAGHGQHGSGDCTCPDGCTAMAPIVPGQALELVSPATLALVQDAPAPQALPLGRQVSPHQARGPPLSA
jgi:hypothetical protein